jgi:hypothetical protein
MTLPPPLKRLALKPTGRKNLEKLRELTSINAYPPICYRPHDPLVVTLQAAVNLVLQVNWGSYSLWILIIEGHDLAQCPFTTVGIVEYGVIAYAYPLDLAFQLTGPFSALQDLLNPPFQLAVIDNRQQRLLVLS